MWCECVGMGAEGGEASEGRRALPCAKEAAAAAVSGKRRGGEWERLWHTTDMSNAWVYVLRFATYAHREGWWSCWLVVGFRSVGLGFESHERKCGGEPLCSCCMEAWSWGLQRPHLRAGNFAVIVSA